MSTTSDEPIIRAADPFQKKLGWMHALTEDIVNLKAEADCAQPETLTDEEEREMTADDWRERTTYREYLWNKYRRHVLHRMLYTVQALASDLSKYSRYAGSRSKFEATLHVRDCEALRLITEAHAILSDQ